MDLITRCPQCSETFSVNLEQLQLRKGYIRCINCAHIFDGYEAVVANPDRQGRPPAEPVLATEPVAPARPAPARQEPVAPTPSRQEPVAPAPSWQESSAPAAHRYEPAASARPRHAPSSYDDEPAPSVVRQRSRGENGPTFSMAPEAALPASAAEPQFRVGGPIKARPEPGFEIGRAAEPGQPLVYIDPKTTSTPAHAGSEPAEYRRTGGFMRLVWLVLVLAALGLLAAQLAYVYRAQIANTVPVLRPLLERGCVPLKCTVPYARNIGAINIMSSSLRAGNVTDAGEAASGAKADPAAKGDMMLSFTMRNTLGQAQEWPTVVLTLTDAAGVAVVRKNLPPDTYLSDATRDGPFPAGAEITVHLPLMLNGRQVNGYKLDKFFQ